MNKKMKGITPIISIIILLLITIALAATAYSYLSGFMSSQISGSFSITNGGLLCSGGQITVMIRNGGMENDITDTFFTMLEIDGVDVSTEVVADLGIAPGRAGRVLDKVMNEINSTGDATGVFDIPWEPGYHQIVIGTDSNVVTERVYCP